MALSDRTKYVQKAGLGDKRAGDELATAIDANTTARTANTAALNGKSIIHSSIVTTSGGAAAEDVAISGVLATDQCFVQLSDDGTNDVSIASAVCAEDKVTITFSGDPGSDTIVNVLVIR